MAMRQSAVSRRPGVGIELRGLEVAGTESRGMVAPRAARSRSHTFRLSSAYHGESTAVSIQKKGPHARSRGEGTREFVVAGVLSLSLFEMESSQADRLHRHPPLSIRTHSPFS